MILGFGRKKQRWMDCWLSGGSTGVTKEAISLQKMGLVKKLALLC